MLVRGTAPTFRSEQLRYAGGGKLELLTPPADPSKDTFVGHFLERRGAGVHHVTIKVSDLGEAVGLLGQAGLDTVDVSFDHATWHEAFLRPSQVGGLVVQIAWAAWSDEEWVAHEGQTSEPPAEGAATLLGPLLQHPDLERARELWAVLGATVHEDDRGLVCSWPGAPLDVAIVEGERAGPLGVRMAGATGLPQDPVLGAAVIPV